MNTRFGKASDGREKICMLLTLSVCRSGGRRRHAGSPHVCDFLTRRHHRVVVRARPVSGSGSLPFACCVLSLFRESPALQPLDIAVPPHQSRRTWKVCNQAVDARNKSSNSILWHISLFWCSLTGIVLLSIRRVPRGILWGCLIQARRSLDDG